MSRRDILFITLITVIPIGVLINARYETISEAENAINAQLANPNGTIFKNIRRTKTDTICGEVNAKNINGEYQGFRFFYISNMTENQTVWIDDDTNKLARKICSYP